MASQQQDLVNKIEDSGLTVVPLGGQSELGQVMWLISYQGQMLILDAGAAYPTRELPGVDLLLPNLNFLEQNYKKITALILTSGHEEYLGAVPYLVKHIPIPKIMAPKFVACMLEQIKYDLGADHNLNKIKIETIDPGEEYQLGSFLLEWLRVNDSVAEACALRINTPEGEVIYTPGFKFDQTPVDGQLTDIGRLAQIGDQGVTLLIAASAGIERTGYSESEMKLYDQLSLNISQAKGRVIVLMSGTNTYRLQILLNIAKKCNRRIALLGSALMRSAVASAMTGNLIYDPQLETNIEEIKKLPDDQILIVATDQEGDPMPILSKLAYDRCESFSTKHGDTIIFSSDIQPGRLRQMAMILDQFLLAGVKVYWGEDQGVHVSRNAGQEELKLMLSLIRPVYLVPAFGEGRHIVHHAKLAYEWGMPSEAVFVLQNGQFLSFKNGLASVEGRVEYQAVFVNREHGERVTTFTVNERRAISEEGLVTISLIIDQSGKLVSGPKFDCGAASFRDSVQWREACSEISLDIIETIEKNAADTSGVEDKDSEVTIRGLVRDIALKKLRTKLQKKPVLQIIIQQLTTSHLQ